MAKRTWDEQIALWGLDLSREHKTACPRCRRNGRDRSGNNLHCYGLDSSGEDKGAFCWACEFGIPDKATRDESEGSNEPEVEEVTTRVQITPKENEQIKSYTGTDCKGWRGIRPETNAFFGVRYSYDEETGEPNKMYTPTTLSLPGESAYELAGYRVRVFPKDFGHSIGQIGREVDMVGEFRFKTHRRTCLIVGGETKMLLAYQMLKDEQDRKDKGQYETCAVVCSTLGEPGAHKQAQLRYAFFEQFQKIIVCMDNDAAGKEAAEKLAKVLPKGRVFIMNMRYKDADVYVEKGKEREFIQDWWAAKAYTPDGIIASSGLMAEIKKNAATPKIPLPPFMHKLQEMMAGGIPLGVIVNLASASGTGKSTIVDEMSYHWVFNSPHKVGVVTLESDSGQYGTKMLSRHLGVKIDLIESVEEKMAYLERPEVEAAAQHLWFNEDGTNRWFLIEERDGGVESLKKLVDELIIACDCKVIILDPLQDILDGLGADEQSLFMRWMKGMIKSHGVTFINVNHVRKSSQGQKANSTGADLHEEDMHGSGSILKSAACNLLFMRNKEAEDDLERNTTRMKASKIRWTGKTGVAGEYYYDNDSHTLWDKDDWLENHPPQY